MDEVPREPPADVPEEHEERAQELQMELLVLEAQLENANFENEEAYRRKIAQKREKLDSLRQ